MAKKLTSTKAKKILHDKTVHGKPLTDKQRKFFGAVASGAIPQAQNGIEGTMGGLTDIGFNYNGAWGGTMAMGGGIPGAVGFTYARTGSIPSNGPYAKKTKASAQKGKTITKREDFEPWWNWASRKAGDVDKRQDAYGTLGDLYAYYAGQPLHYNALEYSEYKPTNAKNPNAKYISINDPKFKQEIFDKYNEVFIKKGTENQTFPTERERDRLKSTKINENTYAVSGYTPSNKKDYEEAKRLGIHPVYMKGKKHVSNAIGRYFISKGKDDKGEYISYYDVFDEGSGPDGGGIGETLRLTKPFEIYDRIYLDPKTGKPKMQNGGEMKYYQEGLDFKPKTISQDGSKNPKKRTLVLAEHDPEYWNNPDGSFSDRYINPFITEAAGIKKYVNKYFPGEDVEIIPTYKQNLKEALAKSDPNTRLVVMGHSGDKMFGIPSEEFISSVAGTNYENCYAGICYADKLPGVGNPKSDYKLPKGQVAPKRFPESYNLRNFNIRDTEAWVGFSPVNRGGEEGFKDSFFRRTKNPEVASLEKQLDKIWNTKDLNIEDYYKKAEKARPIEEKLNNLYRTGRADINLPKAANTKELDYVPLPARTFNYPEDPLRFNPEKIYRNKKEGGIIKDDRGQWAYPGEVTQIDSNQITMQGVPYPVLGISDTGDTQMMYPEEDYTFDGESVTEYPIAQRGKTLPTVNIKKEPIYVDNPNDPRLRAYQDSLRLYNQNNADIPKNAFNFRKYKPHKSSVETGKIKGISNYTGDVDPFAKYKIKPVEQYDFIDKATEAYHNGVYYQGGQDALMTRYLYKKPEQRVEYKKPEPKKEVEQLKPVERKQNIYEGSPVYSPGAGSGLPSALIGFLGQQGDTTFIKPEDYERFGVPKYGREYIEKATKKFKDGGVSVNEADAQPIKKLDQLLNFTNYNDMAKAKKGKKLSKADLGQSLSSINTDLSGMGGIGGASTQLLGGIQQLIEEKKQRQKTKQFAALSDVAVQAATSRPVGMQRKYVRPEDMLVNPGETGSPYGTGYDFLQMENGGFIGGNPTEIQNMYNPGDLYSDLGYEPLEDSSKVKQFKQGGKAFYGMETTGTTTTASPFNTSSFGALGQTLGSFAGGGGGQQSGAGQVGSAVGGIAGNILLPGVGGVIGSALGGAIGGVIGGQSQKKMEQLQRRAQGNLGSAAMQQSLQGQFSGYMEHGGELKYLSREWQPQVITKFGEYDMKDLLKAPKDADMLRAGGHLKSYTPPSERAMQTYAMGGELQTHWGGYAEPISENPYLPDGGETVMFRGQSHEESDGKGRTGIGVTYGDNPVEVERGEPAIKLKDGGTGEDSMVVFGNMIIPSYGVSELNDPKAKGMKFKRYAAELSKLENKANKVSDKALKLIDETDGDDQFGLLSLSTANAMLKGSDMKLKDAAMKKQLAAGIQSAILDTAEELGLENDALAKGKIKPAKGGGKFTSAQMGTALPNSYTDIMFNKFGPFNPLEEVVVQGVKPKGASSKSKVAKAAATAAPIKRQMATLDFTPRELPADMSPIVEIDSLKTTTPGIEKLKSFKAIQPEEDKFNVMDFANQLNPYIRPLLRNPLDPGQLAPEMMALATNVVEPVQAQQYMPMLEQTPTVSFQDQLNEIQAEVNATRRLLGNNPAAQAALFAQAAAAKNKVLGEQMKTNQMFQLESRRRNLDELRKAGALNIDILDRQATRQSQARSATKAQAQLALSSIADKIARNRAETLQANVMSNMYPQYTFGPKGRVFNTGLTTFNTPQLLSQYSSDELQKFVDAKKVEESKKKTGRNGSIVKAIKNL